MLNYSSSPSSLSSTSSSPSLGSFALFMQSSEKARASVQGKPLPTHEHRLVWQLPRHPQQTNSITACGAGARSVQTISRRRSFSCHPWLTGSCSILGCKAFFQRKAWYLGGIGGQRLLAEVSETARFFLCRTFSNVGH